jgi:hypothetical protein
MCGTDFTCLADQHLVDTERASRILGIAERSVRQAVTRGKLHAEGRDRLGYVFDVAEIEDYATRRATPVAQRDREPVPSDASG